MQLVIEYLKEHINHLNYVIKTGDSTGMFTKKYTESKKDDVLIFSKAINLLRENDK